MPERETIWIIGASDGIGAALAREWARRGARLILSARSLDRLKDLAAELGEEHIPIAVDVSDRASIDAAADEVGKIGHIDRIVHLAAIYDPGKVADLDPGMAAQIVTTNLTGSFHIAQVAPALLRTGGQLALCGSVAGYIGLPQGQIYSATKAGVINLAESLRAELSGRVDVRLINPGFVDTRLTQRNTFHMPAIVTPQSAANAIIKGLEAKHFEVHFPRRLTWSLKLLSALPYWAALPLTKRLTQ
ncbi:Short-chain dehydrogenase [Yoonia tamlensis]|uniref:Short-chain dehydrogenase n=1 Tax=Yoonia tamlensis TaxID=390270 RepID=A0A1I6GZI4_9RHOB|nr:SDR family NAD(P)-dependent oxidoreductase [Yoonia tamlensis]SFR47507.1 Short-chain dehydrogenase [Yoonia tamlensis]